MENGVFLSVPLENLRTLIADAVSQALDAREPAPQPPPPAEPEFLSRHDAAKRLRVSLPTLHAMNRRGTLRPIRVAGVRRVLYRREDVEAALLGRAGR